MSHEVIQFVSCHVRRDNLLSDRKYFYAFANEMLLYDATLGKIPRESDFQYVIPNGTKVRVIPVTISQKRMFSVQLTVPPNEHRYLKDADVVYLQIDEKTFFQNFHLCTKIIQEYDTYPEWFYADYANWIYKI